jgi:DNA helicase-2/ATP-dependent DNA helicase PcrA
MLVLAIVLLKKEPIRKFYSNYYQMVIVDEFQDTNSLSFILIKYLSSSEKLILIGDEIQKIYSFIGAIPSVFEKAELEYDMSKIEFTTNYRFEENTRLRQLDKYLREIFNNYDNLNNGLSEKATLNFGFYKTQKGETFKIAQMIQSNIANDNTSAILFRAGNMASYVKSELDNQGISYFNGLFSDVDTSYKKFHDEALRLFNLESGCSKSVSKKVLDKVILKIEKEASKIAPDIATPLTQLLQVFFNSLRNKSISRIDKYSQIQFTLSTYSLKRYMNEIKAKVILTTIHGSKGLEWDYVFIPGVLESKFPTYYGLCKDCKNMNARNSFTNSCEFKYTKELKEQFLIELSVFYVAVTRARKDVYVFANIGQTRFGANKRSCLTKLPNLELIKIQ